MGDLGLVAVVQREEHLLEEHGRLLLREASGRGDLLKELSASAESEC